MTDPFTPQLADGNVPTWAGTEKTDAPRDHFAEQVGECFQPVKHGFTGHPLPERAVLTTVEPSDLRAMIATEIAAQLSEGLEPTWLRYARAAMSWLAVTSLVIIATYSILGWSR